MMLRSVDVASSIAATLVRLAGGLTATPNAEAPSERLILYDFESCPFCRRVREALTQLDLEVEIRPCPKGGHRFRDECSGRGGKAQFPYLVDGGAGLELYESDRIVEHLYRRYGGRPAPAGLVGTFSVLSGSLASALRGAKGTWVAASTAPAEPLELWSFEASPFCRIARERLTELEIPYVLHNVGKNSAHRADFVKRFGRMQVPYLLDPNTGKGLFESADIVAYLDQTYAC